MSQQHDKLQSLPISARALMSPLSISEQARHFLSQAAQQPARGELPDPADKPAWKRWAVATDEWLANLMAPMAALANYEATELNGVPVFLLTPKKMLPDSRAVLLDIHGGALVTGGGECCRLMGSKMAARTGLLTYTVDYRMPPDHPYPAALDDCLAAYRGLLSQYLPAEIFISGSSAGGNLAAALALRARDEGLPLPAGVILLTPEVDLTESGDSFQTNSEVDAVLPHSLMRANLLYADGHDLADPYLSPLFGDFSAGFPPTFLQTGTRDLFLSNTVRMHRALYRAGIDTELQVFDAMPHGGFGGATPEDEEMDEAVRGFIQRFSR